MKELTLPEQFLKRMKHLLGPEYEAFLASFREERKNALRVNRLKLTPGQFEAETPFALERVPWTDNGYYVDYRDRPGQHPYYRAGLYYLQEPSAMAPAGILPVQPGDRVLDLCAAPGGKATELGARLGHSALSGGRRHIISLLSCQSRRCRRSGRYRSRCRSCRTSSALRGCRRR